MKATEALGKTNENRSESDFAGTTAWRWPQQIPDRGKFLGVEPTLDSLCIVSRPVYGPANETDRKPIYRDYLQHQGTIISTISIASIFLALLILRS